MVRRRLVIDPFPRVDGHLRIEVEEENQQVKEAWSQATQFRGIENIVQGRDPRDAWAFVARICGACAGSHSIASVTAVENALGSVPPRQAQLMRDIITVAQTVRSHVMQFYHSHAVDWVNVASAMDADPQKTMEFAKASGSRWKGNTEAAFSHVRETLRGVWDSGQVGVFTGGYWDHPDYHVPPEAGLMIMSHYMDAVDFQRSISRITTMFGGKNPHPHFLVGGMAASINPDKSETLNQVQLDKLGAWINEVVDFINSCFFPDTVMLMSMYREYFRIGASSPNFLSMGMVGARYTGWDSLPVSWGNHIQPAVIVDGDFSRWYPLEPGKIEEHVSSSWLSHTAGNDTALPPTTGETTVGYTGPTPPYTWLADTLEYTWSKAPRYDARPVQVGPLARVVSAFVQGHEKTVFLVNDVIDRLDIALPQLNSTAGRIVARAVEAVTAADYLALELLPAFQGAIARGDFDVFDSSRWDPSSWPDTATGFSLLEVDHGLLGHWVRTEGGAVSRYQVVAPGTWLAGGRDLAGQRGPIEQALAGSAQHPLRNLNQPLELLRTVHSFDPCMPCAVHTLDIDQRVDATEIRVVVP